MKNIKILITGGAGYIGSILVPLLLKQGYIVTVVDTFKSNNNALASSIHDKNFTPIRGDVRDTALMKELTKKADYIIPLAALVGAPLCKDDPVSAKSTNLDAIVSMLEHLSNQQRIIYPTTNSGYGVGEKGVFCDENTPLNPLSLYGNTKVDAERFILDRGNAITLRLATVFGFAPRMRIDLLVNDFVYRAFYDKAVTIFEGNAKRNYIHIRDVANAFFFTISHFDDMKDHAYNVGLSSANLSKIELCEKIKNYIPQFVYLNAPIGEDPDKRDYIVSNEKIEKKGWKAQNTLDDGIQELIKGYTTIHNRAFSNV